MRTRSLTILLLAVAPLVLADPPPAAPPAAPAPAAPDAAPAAPEGRGYQVIVHPSNPAASVTRTQLADVYLKKQTAWPDGSDIEPVEPPESSRTRTYFLSDVMNGRSSLALKAFWQKKASSGRTPPIEKASEVDVVTFVRTTPGAIGYVAPTTAVAGVKVVEVKD